ncbi:hypothetical protein AVEN_1531-1 [Araneus ventricosus]|uniref:Uncharacterized protein n=1 Tax=Araneus ventricosus TaxID=182803 RepID=A0A4Y2F9C3_ARAVE|nr:hypothetical protein AVEN_1531-1 [Araneus ventricosus]
MKSIVVNYGKKYFKILLKLEKPAGVVSPKLFRILFEKGAVSPSPAWIKKFEPIVTQDPMTIRKYLGKESNSQMRSDLNAYRFLLLLAQGQSRIILPRAQIAISTHAHGESDEKEKRQAGVNKYRAQKIASSKHARGEGGFVGDAIIQTDRQSTF